MECLFLCHRSVIIGPLSITKGAESPSAWNPWMVVDLELENVGTRNQLHIGLPF